MSFWNAEQLEILNNDLFNKSAQFHSVLCAGLVSRAGALSFKSANRPTSKQLLTIKGNK